MNISFFEKFTDTLKPQKLSLIKGELLFRQKDSVSNIYRIQSGRIQLNRSTIDGTPIILHVGQKGETIAEASLFSNYYHCSALATLSCEIQYVNKNTLMQFLDNNPKEMKVLLSIFAGQVRDLRAINEIKNIRSANQRVLAFIRNSMDSNKEMSFDCSLKDMSYKIGLTHETFYRELKKLEVSGVISRNNRSIKLN